MTVRPIATSTISFGLVSLPVKLYATGQSSSKVRFNWINRETGSRVKQQYVDSHSGEVVPRENMIKGYEFAKNRYVTFEADELKAMEAESTQSIEITEFVPSQQVTRLYLDRAYYLGPEKGGARAYRLLSAALRDSGKVALAKYSARGKQYLVTIRPIADGLLLEQLRYSHELRSFDDVPRQKGEVSDTELALAKQLIEQGSAETFDPAQYRDEVNERVQALIDRKIQGEQITLAAREEPEAKIIDLMEALKSSLAADRDRRKEREGAQGVKKAATG